MCRSQRWSLTTKRKKSPAAGYRRGLSLQLVRSHLAGATTAVASTGPSLCRISAPRILPSTLVSRESITSPMVIVTTSLPCRIGLVGPWQLQYNTTDDKAPTAMPAAVGVFIWKFIPARNPRPPSCARSRPPHLHVRQSVRRCGHRSPRRRRSPPPRRVPPAPCGR